MRLSLDAHISGPRIAQQLRTAGHDVRAAGEERALAGWSDHDLMALATGEDRIMVTFNVRDFSRLTQQWAEAGLHHAGCAILVGVDHGEFGVVLRTLAASLDARPEQKEWRDYTCFVSREP